ncbi:DNA cytosine methyltransferase [Pseudomonas yamanorum]|uniref:DNA (cytosine-5-)-methyltransferase n=1 Tax=Pseudomonas yamanorum TaxID=515393 RepID=A0AAJ3HBI7_9PSED|nr:DNA cytosine methyltransferase [Pseudomonas yamanorum]
MSNKTTSNVASKNTTDGPPGQPHKVVSLFCGAGGLDLGFTNMGFEVCYAADYDHAAIKTYNHNHPDNTGHVIDLLETTVEQLSTTISEQCGEGAQIAGIIGGPPCQGFSRANNARHVDDPRNQLALKYAAIVNHFFHKFGLKFFVFENVPEIGTGINSPFLKGLRAALSLNFDIYERELNSSHYQVAQVRKRLFIVGVYKGAALGGFEFPAPSEMHVKVVSDVINGLPEPVFSSNGLKAETIPFHQNHWTSRLKSKRFEVGVVASRSRSFVKLDWNKPSRTVAYGNREIHVHPDGRRRLSIFEALQLQGFPFDYVLLGNMSQQVRQVSNAVPPPVAEEIAKAIMAQVI